MNQNMKNVGKKMNLPYDKKLCRVHFILLFNIFYWLYCFCIVYIKIKYYLIPCISLIQIQGFPGEGGEFLNVMRFSQKLSWKTWECQGILFSKVLSTLDWPSIDPAQTHHNNVISPNKLYEVGLTFLW